MAAPRLLSACTTYGDNRYYNATSGGPGAPCCTGLKQCLEPDPYNTSTTRTVCLFDGCDRPPAPPALPPPAPPSPPPTPAFLNWRVSGLQLALTSFDGDSCGEPRPSLTATTDSPTVELPGVTCNPYYAWSLWSVTNPDATAVGNTLWTPTNPGLPEYYGYIYIQMDEAQHITEVIYNSVSSHPEPPTSAHSASLSPRSVPPPPPTDEQPLLYRWFCRPIL